MNLEAEVSTGELAYSPKVLEVCVGKRLHNLANNFLQDEFGEAEQEAIVQEAIEHEAEEQMLKESRPSIGIQAEKTSSEKRKNKTGHEVQIERQ